jgi:hypothetical protein
MRERIVASSGKPVIDDSEESNLTIFPADVNILKKVAGLPFSIRN